MVRDSFIQGERRVRVHECESGNVTSGVPRCHVNTIEVERQYRRCVGVFVTSAHSRCSVCTSDHE